MPSVQGVGTLSYMKKTNITCTLQEENIKVMNLLFDISEGLSVNELSNKLDKDKLNLILEVYPLKFIKLGSFRTKKFLKECISDIVRNKDVFGNTLPSSFYQKELYLIL